MNTRTQESNGDETSAAELSETEWSEWCSEWYYDKMNSDWGPGRLASGPVVQKTYRVPVELYKDALDQAKEREESLSGVIRDALERYADG